MNSCILRLPEVIRRTGYSRPSIYRLKRDGKFPQCFDLGGGKAVGWLEADIERWISARIGAARKAA